MPKLKRSLVVKLMECAGFSTAGALSTGRLQKKINRLDRVCDGDEDLENADEEVLDAFHVVLDAIEINDRIIVIEDRTNIPVYQPERQAKRGKSIAAGISNFDFNRSKYNWDKILSGAIVVMEQGSDFECKPSNFRLQVKSAAKKRGVDVKVAIRKDSVVIQAIKE